MGARRVRQLVAVMLAAFGVLLVQLAFPPASQAHSVLLSSTPADGQVLASAPSSISLQFSEAVEAALTTVRVTDSQGRIYRASSVSLAGEARVDVALPPLPEETYRVSWRTVATDDRHETSGVVVFGVGNRPQLSAPRPADPLPSAPEVGLQWLMLIGLSGLAGGLFLVRLGRLGRRRRAVAVADRLYRTVLGIACVAGVLAFTAAAGLMVVQAGGLPAAVHLASAPFGVRSLARLLAIGALLVLAGRRRRAAGARHGTAALELVCLAAAVVSTALLGHAASSPARTAIEAIHLTFALLWCGTLIAIVLACLALVRGPAGGAGSRREVARMLAAFSSVAVAGVAGLVITGLLLTGDSALTIDALLLSTFGRILMVKLGLAVLGGGLGWASHRRLRRARPSVSVRSLTAEAVLLALVLAGGAALASATPPRGAQWRPAIPVAGSTTASAQVSDLVESVRVLPDRPGHNFVSVGVFNTRRPAPARITGVSVLLAGPDGQRRTIPAAAGQPGEWVAPTDAITTAGTWRLTVQVSLAGRPDVVSSFRWDVAGTTGGPANRVVSQLPAAPLAGTLAALMAAAVAAGLLAAAVRRRRDAARPVLLVLPDAPAPAPDGLVHTGAGPR